MVLSEESMKDKHFQEKDKEKRGTFMFRLSRKTCEVEVDHKFLCELSDEVKITQGKVRSFFYPNV